MNMCIRGRRDFLLIVVVVCLSAVVCHVLSSRVFIYSLFHFISFLPFINNTIVSHYNFKHNTNNKYTHITYSIHSSLCHAYARESYEWISSPLHTFVSVYAHISISFFSTFFSFHFSHVLSHFHLFRFFALLHSFLIFIFFFYNQFPILDKSALINTD